MGVRAWQLLATLVVASVVSGCGSTSSSVMTPSVSSTASSVPAVPTSSAPPTTHPVPDADSIARILLAMPVTQRPVFLDPYGAAIHGSQLGLGPSLRIAGYRANPLFVCVQHVDMKAGKAGAWTAYVVTSTGTTRSGGSGGQCPPAPGRPQIRE